MPGSPGVMRSLAGSGALTYNPNLTSTQRAEWNLSQLASIAGTGARRPYVRTIVVEADLTWQNGNAAARTLTWQRSFEILARGLLQVPGHAFVDAPFSIGRLMRDFFRMMTGRNPEGNGAAPPGSVTVQGGRIADIVIAGVSTATQKLKLVIPFYDHRGVNGEDEMMHAGLFKGGVLQIDWAAATGGADNGGGVFGADVWLHAGSIRAAAEIKRKDDVRFSPWFSFGERQMAALTDYVSPEGVLYTDLYLEGVPSANGLTTPVITNANLTQITLTMQQGDRPIDGLPPSTVVSHYNAHQPYESDGYLAQPESGNLEYLPLHYMTRVNGKKTHILPEIAKPQLQLTGTLPIAQAILGFRFVRPSGPKTVADQAQRADEALPDRNAFPNAVIAPKTDSKQPVKQSKSKWLAQKVYRYGLPGSGS